MIWKYTLAWFGLMVIAVLNGALRTLVYGKRMPELRAHQISCFTGIFLIGIAVYFLNKIWPLETGIQSLIIGLLWLVMTVLFEFGFGHFIMKHPWEKLFHDYRMDKGRLWILVLLWTAIVPYVIYSLH